VTDLPAEIPLRLGPAPCALSKSGCSRSSSLLLHWSLRLRVLRVDGTPLLFRWAPSAVLEPYGDTPYPDRAIRGKYQRAPRKQCATSARGIGLRNTCFFSPLRRYESPRRVTVTSPWFLYHLPCLSRSHHAARVHIAVGASHCARGCLVLNGAAIDRHIPYVEEADRRPMENAHAIVQWITRMPSSNGKRMPSSNGNAQGQRVFFENAAASCQETKDLESLHSPTVFFLVYYSSGHSYRFTCVFIIHSVLLCTWTLFFVSVTLPSCLSFVPARPPLLNSDSSQHIHFSEMFLTFCPLTHLRRFQLSSRCLCLSSLASFSSL